MNVNIIKNLIKLTIISFVVLYIENISNIYAAGDTVGQCSYEISIAIEAGNCDTVGDCWWNIAKKVTGGASCDSVGCTTCDVAEKIAPNELKKYDGLTVGNCSAAIADHLGVENGGWGTSVCNIAEKVEKTKKLN